MKVQRSGQVDDGRAEWFVEGDGAGDDLEAVGLVLRTERCILVRQPIDSGAVEVGRDEDDVVDVILVDKAQQCAALEGVALPAVFGREHAEILNRLGRHDELPGDAVVLGGQQVMGEVLELLMAEQRPVRVEGGR